MSVRPRAAFEASQTFSLRDALGADPDAPQLPQSTSSGLKFDLASLNKMQTPAAASAAATLAEPPPMPPPSGGLSLRFAHSPDPPRKPLAVQEPIKALPNLSFVQMNANRGATTRRNILSGESPAALATKEQVDLKADVMRLTAYVDDLTTRLKNTQHRLDQTEAQLTRTSKVLCHERQNSHKVLQTYKNELTQAHENEARLQCEIAKSKEKTPLKDEDFKASVDSALVSDEKMRLQQRDLAELETKIAAMGDFKVKLEDEVAKLKTLRSEALAALDELRAEHEARELKAKAAEEQLAEKQAEMSAAQNDHAGILERLVAAKAEEAALAEGIETLRLAKASAESEARQAQNGVQATLLAHGDASRKLAEVKARVSALQAKEAATAALVATQFVRVEESAKAHEAIGTEAACSGLTPSPEVARPVAPAARRPRRGVVTGASAPDVQLCSGVPENDAHRRAVAAMPSANIGAILSTDAPTELTLSRVNFIGSTHYVCEDSVGGIGSAAANDPTALLVNAVVGDLKQRLTEMSQHQPVWRAVAPLA